MKILSPSPGTLVAVVALFFALGGTAIAAHHYLITSESQIKPGVLKSLHGATGPWAPRVRRGPRGRQDRPACKVRRVQPI
jgi:hypothetical protein